MKLRTISYTYGRTIPTKQYGNDRLEVTVSAELEEGERPADARSCANWANSRRFDADNWQPSRSPPSPCSPRCHQKQRQPVVALLTSDGRSEHLQARRPGKDNSSLRDGGLCRCLWRRRRRFAELEGFPIYVSSVWTGASERTTVE